MSSLRRYAVFVTPHGFGHATRTCALLEELGRRGDTRFEIFTTVPRWLFEDSLSVDFGYHPCDCDVGLVQSSALSEDSGATVLRLQAFLDTAPSLIAALARRVRELECAEILCDIAPLGLEVARTAGVPSVVIENFVWSFIYENYLEETPALEPLVEGIRDWEASATRRLTVRPFCGVRKGEIFDPVFRSIRQEGRETRDRLGLHEGESMVLWTMGGIPWDFGSLERVVLPEGVVLVVPGAAEEEQRLGSVLLLPRHSPIYHPDLVASASGVLGKLGYSTVAEVWSSGTPFAFLSRPQFPESPFLEEFVDRECRGVRVEPQQLTQGSLVETIKELLSLPRGKSRRLGGTPDLAARIRSGRTSDSESQPANIDG
ncbi:MAG: hypothetical protein K8J08_13005 [Thermoanaerobaculia bacterium]|nr:hypothetical protein [Thermoanaerobaculia bacterium]